MKKRYNRFTLVELLVVICIASLLMGVVLPAFSRMVTGSAVDRLASNLKLRLERARSHAASSRRHVALVLPHGTDSTWKESAEQSARLGGSRMCYVNWNSDDHTAAFQRWVPDEEWSTPERGAYLLRATRNESDIVKEGNAQPIDTNGSSGIDTLLYSGTADSADSKPLKDLTGILSPGTTSSPANSAIVFSPNGNVRSTADVYLVIGEAMNNGSTLVFPGGGVYNFRVLKINRITGKVEYFSK